MNLRVSLNPKPFLFQVLIPFFLWGGGGGSLLNPFKRNKCHPSFIPRFPGGPEGRLVDLLESEEVGQMEGLGFRVYRVGVRV